MFICICCCGEACGFGEAAGICMPGMFISIFCGDAEGDGVLWGIFIPGMFICCGEGLVVGELFVAGIFIPGIFIPGMFCVPGFIVELDRLLLCRCLLRRVLDIFIPGIFIPGMFAILCFLAGLRFLVGVFLFCAGLLLLMPGMFCMSWPCILALLVNESIKPVMMTAQSPAILVRAPKPNFFIVPPDELLEKQSDENAHTKAHVRAKTSDDS